VQIPFWDQFLGLVFGALLAIQQVVGDWGMSIILLTIAVRILLLPLTWKQTKAMVELQRIQPKLKELQEKYKDDKEKYQEETLKFYQENKVNPLGGCLPLILQMPILFALYAVLGNQGNKAGKLIQHLQQTHETGTFYGLIPDISKTPAAIYASHDYAMLVPYVLLVLLFGVSVWLPQALMPGDKQQKQIGGFMAIFMLYFGWISPAGVLLYWDVSSLWGVVQQQITMSITQRELAATEESKPTADASEAVEKKKASNKTASKKNKKS
jgi:YidC/Oxa1 family membrane protein insertase